MESLTWFEEICRQLSKDPAAATQVIRDFQDTREAYQLSRHFFGRSSSHERRTHPNTVDSCGAEECQYQALSILQHSFLRNWNNIDVCLLIFPMLSDSRRTTKQSSICGTIS
jgi:hypothetical protein